MTINYACRLLFMVVSAIAIVVPSALSIENPPPRLKAHNGPITAIAFSPDSTHLVTGSVDLSLRVATVPDGKESLRLPGHLGVISDVTYGPAGHWVAASVADKTVRVWLLDPTKQLRRFGGHTLEVNAIAATPEGKHVISASDDESLRVWDVGTGRESLRLTKGRERYVAVTSSPTGATFYSLGLARDGPPAIREWSIEEKKELRIVAELPKGQSRLVLDPTGKVLATYCAESGPAATGAIHLWDVAGGQSIGICEGHEGPLVGAAFVANGKYLVSVGADGSVRVWHVAERRVTHLLREKEDQRGYRAMACSSDSRWLALGYDDGSLEMVRLPSAVQPEIVLGERTAKGTTAKEERNPGVLAPAERPGGKIDPGMDKKQRIADGKPRPQLRFKEGDTFYQRISVVRKGVHRVQGLDLATHSQYELGARFKVIKRLENGWLMEQLVERAKLEAADEITQSLLADAIAKLPGARHTMEVSEHGVVSKIEGVQDNLKAVGAVNPLAGGRAAMTAVLTKDAWKELNELTLFSPDLALEAGAKWERPVRHAWGPLGAWKGKASYRYEGKLHFRHKIGYELQLTHEAGEGKGGGLPIQLGQASFKLLEGKGTILFDAERGRVAAAEETFRTRGSLSLNLLGQMVPLEMEEEQLFRIQVSDKDPQGRP